MTELEKMQRAKMYIDKMANGINPIDDIPAAESDMINNVRLSRCLFYVSDILRQVIDNKGIIGKTEPTKKAFFLSSDCICNFAFSDIPISISEITKRLNDLANLEVCCKLKNTAITNWLVSIEMLEIRRLADGKNTKMPTQQGKELGITSEKRIGIHGKYIAVVYNKEAQQFILDNIEAIVSYFNNTDRKAYNQGQVWTAAHEECLVDLFNKNVPVSEIAVTLMRTEKGIRAKLKKMGLVDNRSDAI